jgi:hypothetical protein
MEPAMCRARASSAQHRKGYLLRFASEAISTGSIVKWRREAKKEKIQ